MGVGVAAVLAIEGASTATSGQRSLDLGGAQQDCHG
jgi:hypothetical protein